ncbi:hypothetical protein HHI36_018608 [Cryptolaemus montrouzieri]|uniref:Uncharacterized protein n=1 Tax=Cryptolaemus montrouzieri TaxID=559131 RepID=A0ABD2P0N1_9CUCU
MGNYSQRSELPRFKAGIDRKESQHPPVSYRPLGRTTSKSRDPSPTERSERSTSSSVSYNRLAPPSFTRSTSRERTNSTSSIGSITSTIPKYNGRLSLNQDDTTNCNKYTGKIDKYDDSKYKGLRRTISREDVGGSSKYITSRFLPKNSIERSYTGYSRGSSSLAKANETSRKNRELLNVLHVQQDAGGRSRSVSRCSSVNFDDIPQRSPRESTPESSHSVDKIEMVTVNVTTRATSPTPARNSSLLKPRRLEIAKTVEKQITKPKHCRNSADKESQSDRLDDTTKASKFAGGGRISATPWNSILDMKFSSPTKKLTKSSSNSSESSGNEQHLKKKEINPGITKSHSNKTVGHSCVPEEKMLHKSNSGKSERKLLPPQIPTRDSSSKSLSMHFLSSQQNKDFRKSILNMSDLAKKKVGRRSNSVSSADSESENQKDSEATDVSENLASCRSFHNSSSLNSKLPQKVNSEKSINNRSRRSPSSDLSLSLSSANLSCNEEEGRTKQEKVNQGKTEGTSNSEAKSFLIRALTPVTNFFKDKKQEEEDRVKWILDSSSEGNSAIKPCAKHNSDDAASFQTNNSHEINDDVDVKTLKVPKIRHIQSGEIPWWLDETAQVPEGVQTYPNWVNENGMTSDGKVMYKIRKNESSNSSWWNETSETSESHGSRPTGVAECSHEENGNSGYKLRRNDSAKIGWWLDSSENSNSGNQKKNQALDGEYIVQKDEHGRVLYEMRKNEAVNSKNQPLDSEHLELHKLRHIDSGDRSWWLSSQENLAEDTQNVNSLDVPKYNIRHQDSGEPAWWLQNEDDGGENDNQIPLGDRASPEGLEMPKEEGRLSPYDNVPDVHSKIRPNTLFISRHTNIDDILGGPSQIWSPLMEKIFHYGGDQVDACDVKIGRVENTCFPESPRANYRTTQVSF